LYLIESKNHPQIAYTHAPTHKGERGKESERKRERERKKEIGRILKN